MKIILFIMIGLSILNADFTKSGDIVTDNASTLQWQDDAVGSTMTWESAITHCEGLTFDNHSDWRLPNKKELLSIVDYSTYNPAIRSAFINTTSSNYWSSTTYASSTSYAWGVRFSNGYTYVSIKGNNWYVRCVRAGQ